MVEWEQFEELQERIKTTDSRLNVAREVTKRRLQEKKEKQEKLLELIKSFLKEHEKNGAEKLVKLQQMLKEEKGIIYLTQRSLKAYQQTTEILNHERHYPFIEQLLSRIPDEVAKHKELRPVIQQHQNIKSLAEITRSYLNGLITTTLEQLTHLQSFHDHLDLWSLYNYLTACDDVDKQLENMAKALKPVIYQIKTTTKELQRIARKGHHFLHNKVVVATIGAALLAGLYGPQILELLGYASESTIFYDLYKIVKHIHVVEASIAIGSLISIMKVKLAKA